MPGGPRVHQGRAVFRESAASPAAKTSPYVSAGQLRGSLGVDRALGQDRTPEAPGLGRIIPLRSQRGQVAQGQMAVDSLVHATELVGTVQRQDSPERGLGPGRLTGQAVTNRLAEEQLRVVRVEGETF